MQCISIRQPWALLVCAGIKRIENRTWQTSHRGVLAIHTGAYRKGVPAQIDPALQKLFTFGAIIGTVDVYDVVPIAEANGEDWAEGPYCFRLRDAKLFANPIPYKGRLGLSKLPDNIAKMVTEHNHHPLDVSGREFQTLFDLFPPAPIDKSLLRKVERYGSP